MPIVHSAKTADDPLPSVLSRSWFQAALLVAVIGLIYGNTLQSPFLFDDLGAVQNNLSIRHWSTALSPPVDGSATTGRPLLNLTFALSYRLSGDAVWGHHVANLALHAVAALTLFGLVRRTLAGPVLGRSFRLLAQPLAFAVALLWAIHPLLSESVTCIAQRTESLCGVFYLLTLYAFARAVGSSHRGWFVLSVFVCLLGMGSKEVMATAPLMVLLYDRTFVAGSFAVAWRDRRSYYLALASTWLLLLALVLAGGGARGSAAGFGLGVSWWAYLLKQCEALVLYLQLVLWPHPLVLDYGTDVIHSVAAVWWQGSLVLGLLAATVWALVRRPALGFLGAWFFLILAPSSSVIPLVTQTMAEHRMYLPAAAVIAGLVVAAYRGLGARVWPFFGAIALILAALTVARNQDYRSALLIWQDTAAKCPGSARAQVNLGVEFLHLGRPSEAAGHFETAVKFQPDSVSAYYHWGSALLEQGRAIDAISKLEAAIRLGPAHADAHLALGNALVRAGRPAEALPHYTESLRLKPAADANFNRGIALAALGRPAEAAADFRCAINLPSALPEAHYQLGLVLEQLGRPVDAEASFLHTLSLRPDHAGSHDRLGLLLARAGRLDEAAAHFRAVLRVNPSAVEASANLGNVLLLEGRVREAITCYEAVLRERPDDARVRGNLQLAREALEATR